MRRVESDVKVYSVKSGLQKLSSNGSIISHNMVFTCYVALELSKSLLLEDGDDEWFVSRVGQQ